MPDDPTLAEELLPCPNPWCTKSEPELQQGGFRNGHFRVECQNCFTKGPTRNDLNGGGPAAIKAWNTRTSVPASPRVDEGVDPAYMEWPALSQMLRDRLHDDDFKDNDLVATRAETCALLEWAGLFDREAQPRRDEEERTYALIRRAAELIETRPSANPVIPVDEPALVGDLLAALEGLLSDTSFRDDREHWVREQELGNENAPIILAAIDAIAKAKSASAHPVIEADAIERETDRSDCPVAFCKTYGCQGAPHCIRAMPPSTAGETDR